MIGKYLEQRLCEIMVMIIIDSLNGRDIDLSLRCEFMRVSYLKKCYDHIDYVDVGLYTSIGMNSMSRVRLKVNKFNSINNVINYEF